MTTTDSPVDLVRSLSLASGGGFAAALHIQYTSPKYLFQSYPKGWIDRYSQLGLVMQDPTVHWGFANLGAVRWRDLEAEDTAGVLTMAREYGLNYGVTIALCPGQSRSVASFARSERDFTDAEIDTLTSLLTRLHTASATESLSSDDHAALKQMSVVLTHS